MEAMKKMLRLHGVLDVTGDKPSAFHAKVAAGLFVPPVKMGARCVAWPDFEVVAIVNARIAGRAEEEIKLLVQRLVEARKTADAPETSAHGAAFPKAVAHQSAAA